MIRTGTKVLSRPEKKTAKTGVSAVMLLLLCICAFAKALENVTGELPALYYIKNVKIRQIYYI